MTLKLFDSLCKMGLPPDERTYSCAILACFRGKQWQKAMELFGIMIRDGKIPDKQTVNMLVELLDSEGETERAVYVFEAVFGLRESPEQTDPFYGDVMDLHGYSAAVARAAIRSGLKRTLRRFLVSEKNPDVVRNFTFITGIGKHSRRPFEPVLRPAAQNMFLDEFDPPLAAHLEPGNLGRLRVKREDLLAWCVRESQRSSRKPCPADAAWSFKLKGPEEMRAEFESAKAKMKDEAM